MSPITPRQPLRKLNAEARNIELEHHRPLWEVLVLARAKHGDQRDTARSLGITRQTLRNWLKRYYGATAADLANAVEEAKL